MQGRAQDFSLGKTEGRERGWVSLGGDTNPSPPVRGLGSAVGSPVGFGQSPDRSKVFHYFQHSASADTLILLIVEPLGARPLCPSLRTLLTMRDRVRGAMRRQKIFGDMQQTWNFGHFS